MAKSGYIQGKKKKKKRSTPRVILLLAYSPRLSGLHLFKLKVAPGSTCLIAYLTKTQYKQEILSSFKAFFHNHKESLSQDPPTGAVSGQDSATLHSLGISSYHFTFLPPHFLLALRTGLPHQCQAYPGNLLFGHSISSSC